MSKICTAGVRGPYSYVILNNTKEIISTIKQDDKDIVTTHLDMDFAEKWVDDQIESLIRKNYEIN